ncbi:MAG: glycosyltransferase family 4 protein [candidate division Zixibacteria bacterium]|nr:glycosyltransferase family 4 protein [candidate division Zixibacteria bacterium]
MILYLTYSADGNRGGEIIHRCIHKYLKDHYRDVSPSIIPKLTNKMCNPLYNALYNALLIFKAKPKILVVDVSSAFRSILAVYLMRLRKQQVMVAIFGEREDYRSNLFIVKWIARKCEKLMLRNASVVLVLSEFLRKTVETVVDPSTPIVIAKPGIDFTTDESQARTLQNQSGDRNFELLFVGECEYRKGLAFLVEAAGILKNENIHINVVGNYSFDNRYFTDICRFIKQERLESKISFLGFMEKDQLMKLYSSSDLFVLPSLTEGFGLVLAEAIHFGLPIVATNVSAIPELIVDEVNGLLVQPGNASSLADGIMRIMKDKDLRGSMREANLKYSKALPSWNSFNKTLDAKLNPILFELTNS